MQIQINSDVSFVPHEDGIQGMLYDDRDQTLALLNRRGRFAWEAFEEGEYGSALIRYTTEVNGASLPSENVEEEFEAFLARCSNKGWITTTT